MSQEPAKVLCVPSLRPSLNGAPPGTTHPSGESSSRSKRFTANESACRLSAPRTRPSEEDRDASPAPVHATALDQLALDLHHSCRWGSSCAEDVGDGSNDHAQQKQDEAHYGRAAVVDADEVD